MRYRTITTLLASIALHVVILAFTQGSSSFKSGPQIKGVRLPPISVDVTIRTPEQPAVREAVTPLAPLPLFDIPHPISPKDEAPRLLTPPPFPFEQLGADALPMPDLSGFIPTNYLPSSTLTVRPRPSREPEIQLPPGWLEAFGVAKLTLYLSADGKVDAITILKTDLPPEIQTAVREAFEKLQFSPGQIDGRAVPAVMTIETTVALTMSGRR